MILEGLKWQTVYKQFSTGQKEKNEGFSMILDCHIKNINKKNY
jgi:hypothetical protein